VAIRDQVEVQMAEGDREREEKAAGLSVSLFTRRSYHDVRGESRGDLDSEPIMTRNYPFG
jgi:hypothetical protein